MFKSGDSRAVWTWVWTWKFLKWALHYSHDVIYGTQCGPDWSFRRCFCSRKRCVRLWRNDVRKYIADALLFREIQCKKMDNLMFKQRFQCELSWNKVNYARITITHVCFSINTRRVPRMMLNHHYRPRCQTTSSGPGKVKWKNMCDLYCYIHQIVSRGTPRLSNHRGNWTGKIIETSLLYTSDSIQRDPQTVQSQRQLNW